MSIDDPTPRKSDQWNPDLNAPRGDEATAVAVLVLALAGVAICIVAALIVVLV